MQQASAGTRQPKTINQNPSHIMTHLATTALPGPLASQARLPLRNFFRVAIAAAAAVATGSLTQAAPAPVLGNVGAAAKLPTGVPFVLLGSRTVAITDTIPGAGESIRFAGNAIISAQLIDDLVTKAPRVLELVIDFSGVTATGVTSGKRFMTTAQSILHRTARPFDMVEVSFPYYVSGDMSSARTAMAAFSVGLDGATLSITSKLSTPA